MILVDTSVWIDHLRRGTRVLAGLLNAGRALGHPFVAGEVALGTLSARGVVLDALLNLPQATRAADEEVLRFIENERLYGLGIGYVDAHLLAATRLTPGAALWTHDGRLAAAAERLGVAPRNLPPSI